MTNITLLSRAGQSRTLTNRAVSDVCILMSLAGHVRGGWIARGECHVPACAGDFCEAYASGRAKRSGQWRAN
jgi:hypothetical protein